MPRSNSGFPLDFKGSFMDEDVEKRETTTGPPKAGFNRMNSKESGDEEFDVKEGAKDVRNEKNLRRGTRLLRRMSTWRRRSLMPGALVVTRTSEMPKLSSL